MCSTSSHCRCLSPRVSNKEKLPPGFDLGKIVHLRQSVHDTVEDFVNAVTSEFIQYPAERQKGVVAARAVKSLETCFEEVERVLTSLDESEGVCMALKLVSDNRKEVSTDVIAFQHGINCLEDRKAQYFKCSPLTRSFISPRAERWNPWDDESASPRSRELGTFYCVFIPLVVCALFVTGYLLSSMDIGLKKSEIESAPHPLPRFNLRISPTNMTGLGSSLQNLLPSSSKDGKAPCAVEIHDTEL